MFENLRRAFREAVENFNREMERDAVPETVDGLVRGMEREATDARLALEALRRELEIARGKAAAEEREVVVCRRREEQARGIGDEETERIAADFAEKHSRRHRVLANKADAVAAEITLRESEFKEMIRQIRKAQASRGSLKATAGRTRARRTVQGTDDLFDEMDRMAEKIDATGPGAPADDGRAFDEALGRSGREERIDAQLEELKRRMGKR